MASDFTLTIILAGGSGTALPFATSISPQIGQTAIELDDQLYVAAVEGSKFDASE